MHPDTLKLCLAAFALVATPFTWLFGYLRVPPTISPFSSRGTEWFVACVLFFVPFLLPLVGYLFLKTQPRSKWSKRLLFPALLVSLMPVVVLVCGILARWFSPQPG